MHGATRNIATLGGGCFWCTAAIFKAVKGVVSVVAGYTGGTAPGRPTYREVCSGRTGHAEVVQITYDAALIGFSDLLLIFMTTHDATTLNGQGADLGTQYRSVIYYNSPEEQRLATIILREIARYYPNPIVTQVSPLGIFYPAEPHHQDYYDNHRTQDYCQMVIRPKLDTLQKLHGDKLKP